MSPDPTGASAARARPSEDAVPAAVPLVSVVIPCHGQAHFLPEAVESALGQTHPRIEVVVVDDGSPDDTAVVAARYPGVRLVQQAQQGLAAARNAGFAASRGAFAVFLDADDRLLPDAVEAGLRAFGRHPEAAFVAGRHVRVDAEGRFLEAPEPMPFGDAPYLSFLRGNPIGMHAAVLYRRAAVEGAGGFDPALKACEDYDLYLRVARQAPVAQHDAVVAEYRRHGANMSGDAAFMLRAVLGVLRRQRSLAAGTSERRAYRDGLRIWKDYYGEALEAELRAGRGQRQAGGALLRYAPRRLARWAIRRAVRVGKRLARKLIPRRHVAVPPVGIVRWGDLRRTSPLSGDFGFDRGRPLDRYYIEAFLARHAPDVRGRVLEIGDDAYTRRFGGEQISQSDVLHVAEGNSQATFVGTLESAHHLPTDAFDCVILTQTLHLIYDVHAALATAYRILAPGGVLLATVPGISQVDRGEWGATWCWAMTPYALRRLLGDAFPEGEVAVEAHGNVLAATAFLYGLADRELTPAELDAHDPAYPMLVAGRAVKPATPL